MYRLERLKRLELASALMSDVPAIAGQEVSVRAGHRVSLEVAF
jgi:hypothetical protein